MLLKKAPTFLACFLLFSFLTGCTKELPTLTATSSTRLTDALVLQAQLSKNNQQAFLLTKGPIFTRWDIAKGKVLNVITAHQFNSNIRAFMISDNETRLLTSSGKILSLWQMDDFQFIGSLDFRQHLGDVNITSMAFISDTEIVTGNSDGSLIYADIQNNLFRQSRLHSGEVVRLIPGKNKQMLYSAGNDGKVIASDLLVYEVKKEFSTPFRITSLLSNKDNSLLFISDALDRQVIWKPRPNKVITELEYWQQYRFFRQGLFMDNDTYLLTTSPKTEISLWNAITGEELAIWQATSHSLGSTIADVKQLPKQADNHTDF